MFADDASVYGVEGRVQYELSVSAFWKRYTKLHYDVEPDSYTVDSISSDRVVVTFPFTRHWVEDGPKAVQGQETVVFSRKTALITHVSAKV